MLTRSKSQREKLVYIDEVDAFAKRKSAIKYREHKEGESSSKFSVHTTHSATFDMAAEVPNPTRIVVLGDYVIPKSEAKRA